MRKYFNIVAFLVVCFLYNISKAQTVSVCTKVNGVSPLPTKGAMMCPNGSLLLSMTNCAAVPQSNVSYRWRNIDIAPADTLKSTVIAKSLGRWVGYIYDNVAMVEYSDTVFVTATPAT